MVAYLFRARVGAVLRDFGTCYSGFFGCSGQFCHSCRIWEKPARTQWLAPCQNKLPYEYRCYFLMWHFPLDYHVIFLCCRICLPSACCLSRLVYFDFRHMTEDRWLRWARVVVLLLQLMYQLCAIVFCCFWKVSSVEYIIRHRNTVGFSRALYWHIVSLW